MTITLGAQGDFGQVTRDGSAIEVNLGPCSGGPTVTNTSAIAINGAPSARTAAAVDLTGGPLAPGFSPTPGDPSPSIPVTYTAGTAFGDEFLVLGGPAVNSFAFGQAGTTGLFNLDVAAEGEDPDSDGLFTGVETVTAIARGTASTISAGGGSATGGPLTTTFSAHGGEGPDAFRSGTGSTAFFGGAGDDVLDAAGAAVASLHPGRGDDVVTGGLSVNDTVEYVNEPAAVTVDLARTGKQDTGGSGQDTIVGVENAIGTSFDDVLRGNDISNRLTGGKGADVLEGRGGKLDTLIGGTLQSDTAGVDTVSYASAAAPVNVSLAAQARPQDTGGQGVDLIAGMANVVGGSAADTITGDAQDNRIDARDGIGDTVDCAGGNDSVVADLAGVDALMGCEAADFFVPPPAQPEPEPQPPADPVAPPAQPQAADRSLTFSLKAAKKQKLGTKGTLTVTVACPAEPCNARLKAAVLIAAPRGATTAKPLTAAAASASLAAGKRRTIALKLSRKAVKRVRSALAARRKVTVTVKATAADRAGNRRTASRIVTLVR